MEEKRWALFGRWSAVLIGLAGLCAAALLPELGTATKIVLGVFSIAFAVAGFRG